MVFHRPLSFVHRLPLQHAQFEATGFRHVVHAPGRVEDEVELDVIDAGYAARCGFDLAGQNARRRAVGRGEGHFDIGLPVFLHLDVINEAEFVDVDGDFGVVHGFERFDDVFFDGFGIDGAVGFGCRCRGFLGCLHIVDAIGRGFVAFVRVIAFAKDVEQVHGKSLRCNGFFGVFERCVQGVPGQGGAFDAHGVFAHAGKNGEFAEVFQVGRRIHVGGDHGLKVFKIRFGFRDGFAFDGVGHERCRGFGDGATRSLKGDVGNAVAIECDKDFYAVTTQGIVAFGLAVRMIDDPEVVRAFVVIQNDLLVQFAQVGHG